MRELIEQAAGHLPLVVGAGWLVRVPLLNGEEGHEAITRAAWDGLALTGEKQRALIRGVRAPDVSFFGVLTSVLPFAQRRHALRAWSGQTTADAVREVREFIAATHLRALAATSGPRRWARFGAVLHCLQDAYSPAHVDRVDGRISRMKHWGPLDGLRRGGSGEPHDEHGFPADRRDSVWRDGTLTDEALAAADASRRYLEMAMRQSASDADPASCQRELASFLDACM
jgi:hypothetical protein